MPFDSRGARQKFACATSALPMQQYAKCIDGQHEIAKRRIAEALHDDAVQVGGASAASDDEEAEDGGSG